MPKVFPFNAIQYNQGRGDLSTKVAPPYDVLSPEDKDALLAKDPHNIVAIDLPHMPPKELGPREVYQRAATTLNQWLSDGILTNNDSPAIFAYRQSFDFQGKQYQRCGMACTIEVMPFGPRQGGGVLPHEQTFSGPKEDRFALMKATQTQLSPIFGLHADDDSLASTITRELMDQRPPDACATLDDGVLNEVWTITDPTVISNYQDALAGEDIFIADGHHRYTTGLNYLHELEKHSDVPADHPARRCMIVLVGMSDPGLAIGPTHRVLGGMADYTIEHFIDAATHDFVIHEVASNPNAIENAITHASASVGHSVVGLIDLASERCFVATSKNPDPLAIEFPDKPQAWRMLDVAIIQHLIVERICQPKLNHGNPVTWAFPHSIPEVLDIAKGKETGAGGAGDAQLAIIVRPTPLQAVKEISKANELMPQKSTFFYPKLTTGLFINPLSPNI